MIKVRASEEVAGLIEKLMADADALKSKYADSDMPPEDVETLENLVAQLEALEQEKAEAQVAERMAAIKVRQSAPVRPAPRLTPVHRTPAVSAGEGMALWLNSFGPNADRSPEAVYKARSIGIDLGNPSFRMPVDYNRLNHKRRTVLTKGGSGTGAEYVWQSYSEKVVEYLSYFSPVLQYLDSETTADGNNRTYFVVDDTGLESTYLTASGGDETTPTIPDTNIATGDKVIATFDITSGYQKVSFQELRDSYISLEDKVAKANSNSHARKLEREIFTATGNGTTGVQGLASAAYALSSPSAWTQDVVMDAITSIPPQYRKDVILASNDSTKNDINKALRDDIGRSLFERHIENDMEFDLLLGKKFIVSQFIAANQLLVFVPSFYKLRLVEGQMFQQFVERFWPHVAWAGIMSFGGAWIGPTGSTGAVKKVTLA